MYIEGDYSVYNKETEIIKFEKNVLFNDRTKNIKVETVIEEISESENISPDILLQYIKSFEKYIKSEIKKYDDKSGLDDFKMNKYDYKILHKLYFSTTSSPYKIHILLLYMYSYYKLDGISFNKNYFPLKFFFNFLSKNKNIHTEILKMIK